MKLLIIICLCIIPTITMANDSPIMSTVAECKDWRLIDYRDGVTYERSYLVVTRNHPTLGKPGLIFRLSNKPNVVFLFVSDDLSGSIITYRIDKNPPVSFTTQGRSFAVKGSAFNRMVRDFKIGNSVVYTITRSGDYDKNLKLEKTEQVSLIGFTKLYNKAVSLSKKMRGGIDYIE